MISIQDDSLNIVKILFTGLDKSGKSSIILTLLHDTATIPELQPTRGAKYRDFEFLGMRIAEWDLGGQKVYRKAYLNNEPEKILGGTEILLFVIDIQDKERVAEALDYLNDIYKQFGLLDIQPFIYVFFHKYDPVSMISSQVKAEMNNFCLELRQEIKSLLDYPKLEFYKTSIHEMQSLIIAVSRILLSLNPKSKIIKNIILDFAERLEIEALELIDDNSLIMGSFYKNQHIEKLMNAITPFFLEVNEIFEKVSFPQPYHDETEDEMTIHKFGKYFLFKKFSLKDIESNFYFLNCKSDLFFKKSEFEVLANLIKEILRS